MSKILSKDDPNYVDDIAAVKGFAIFGGFVLFVALAILFLCFLAGREYKIKSRKIFKMYAELYDADPRILRATRVNGFSMVTPEEATVIDRSRDQLGRLSAANNEFVLLKRCVAQVRRDFKSLKLCATIFENKDEVDVRAYAVCKCRLHRLRNAILDLCNSVRGLSEALAAFLEPDFRADFANVGDERRASLLFEQKIAFAANLNAFQQQLKVMCKVLSGLENSSAHLMVGLLANIPAIEAELDKMKCLSESLDSQNKTLETELQDTELRFLTTIDVLMRGANK